MTGNKTEVTVTLSIIKEIMRIQIEMRDMLLDANFNTPDEVNQALVYPNIDYLSS